MSKHEKKYSNTKTKIPLIRRPWFAFISSMRFAVALLSILAIASIIGTVVQQNQPSQNYVVKFGPFWAEIFHFLGLFDVYASSWFVVIMIFLVLSTGLCVWRNTPNYLREMKSFRLNATAKSLAHMKHSAELPSVFSGSLKPEIVEKYLSIQGFKTKTEKREDGSIIVAAKKGAMNKWGYILAHLALIVICLGGLVDSNLLLKVGMLVGKIQPDTTSVYARDFKPESTLSEYNLSFRGNAEVIEGQTIDQTFLNVDKGLLLQKLPFTVELKKFHIDFYDTGMPKDFASDIVVTDKKTGEKIEKTIRVNHPLTMNGVTIYQASYGDGGSDIQLNTWNLRGIGKPADLKAVSQRAFPLDLGSAGQYQLEFGELRVFNVEDLNEHDRQPENKLHEIRSVNQEKKFQNVGPTITYKVRDGAGQAHEYVSYMLPLPREGSLFFATGERSDINTPYRWLMIPADHNAKIDSFMALRDVLLQPEQRAMIVEKTILGVDETMRPQFKLAVENLLRQFAEGGYLAINEHIQNNVPESEQTKTGEFMYQILYGAMNTALDEGLKNAGLPEMPSGEARNKFLLNSMDGYTGLTRFNAPVLLQLTGFKQVNMSGLQMTKSPGASLVYIGSLFLVLGVLFMFYVREKRAWALFHTDGSVRFAMSSNRHERDLIKEFPARVKDLETLGRDLSKQN
ncbi:cytochrome c biogenesis protein ResB [Wielerella bovis]|uniref:cytochrome c biogenesis protein ResB n=1 Tax=Wielerella bovis TaxID=2917790 RepID=UPI002019E268|nr:cytochrome c biogenesis protein ResB [Wielerella bovis]MCG7657246.1 cytochrome c biogenesis protein ResB [Wielerella bovis]MCG7659468.1 cytochrome c biogenesis protein ResB [Wielerella bovis]